jgi:pyridoxamine 5'-phosphate oxidase family protein
MESVHMTPFKQQELDYLARERRLGRLATVGRDGMLHVTPVGWALNEELGTIDVGGIDLATTKKFRDVARSGVAAIVIDDVLPPWRPRGVEVRADAEAVDGSPALIRLRPRRIRSWGLESSTFVTRLARNVNKISTTSPPTQAGERDGDP